MSIASEITRLQTAKADIKTAIENKGVTVPSAATLDDYSTYVDQIQGGGSNKLKSMVDNTITEITASDLSGITRIFDYKFYFCTSLTAITIPDTVVTINQYAFCHATNLASVTIPNSVTSLGNYAFTDTINLHSITLPSGLTSIGDNCFLVGGLTALTIPASVTSIGAGAFSGNTGMTAFVFESTTPPTLGGNGVFGSSNNCPIYVPSSAVETYKTATRWTGWASRIQANPNE